MNTKPLPLKVTLAVLTVAATALPMVPVWQAQRAVPQPRYPGGTADNIADVGRADRTLAVDLRDDATPAQIQDLNARYNLDLEPNSVEASSDKLMVATIPAGQYDLNLLDKLRREPLVEAVEPEMQFSVPEQGQTAARVWDNKQLGIASGSTGPLGFLHRRFVPNDPRYGEQWNFKMVGAEAAWKRTRGKGIVVAVIDTGVAGTDSSRGKQARDFGTTNLVPGYDFIHDDEDAYDDNGHGTHVAGTIAESTNNKEGVAGLAFEASIMPLKVLSAEGWGSSSDIADAIRYAADHGANVINMSLGSYSPSEVIHVACRYAAKKGVVIVCAAGNGFGEGVGFPAAYPECIAVSSVGPNSNRAFYSSYGREVTLAAPGGDMISGGEAGGILQNTVLSIDEDGLPGDDYYFFQGTSMASPHVAATAALLMAQGIHDRARVRDILARSAVPKAPRLEYGAGILSADRATALAITQAHRYLFKSLLFVLLAGGLMLLLPGRPLPVRLVFLAALWVGCFAPDQIAVDVGADSPWNLIGFSALIPFMLFWEWEHGVGSQIVATLAAGFACCLSFALLMGLSPFTATTFGHTALLWTLANIASCVLLAGVAWERGKLKEV